MSGYTADNSLWQHNSIRVFTVSTVDFRRTQKDFHWLENDKEWKEAAAETLFSLEEKQCNTFRWKQSKVQQFTFNKK